jgi:hypothetical protein
MPRAALTVVGALALALPVAASADQWVHVRVVESGKKASTVRVNVPLSLIETVAPIATREMGKEAKIKLEEKEFTRADLKKILTAVRESKDAEFVTVESDSEHVRVAKSGQTLIVKVRDQVKKSDKVTVQVPMAVVDALLSGTEDELNVVAAIQALGRTGSGELVTVDDNSATVRVWIDDKSASE